METIIKNAKGTIMVRFTENGCLVINGKYTYPFDAPEGWNIEESISNWINLCPFDCTPEEFHAALLQTINELTIELNNVAKSIKNEFIENEELKQKGY